MSSHSTALPIASVERETGLSADILRTWERRHGFPAPSRNAEGGRMYPQKQVRRLARIKRLMDRGLSPEALLAMDERALSALDDWMRLAGTPDHPSMQRLFHRELAKLGMLDFVQNTLVPLIRLASEAWARNQMDLLDEHLLWENIEQCFRKAIADLAPLEDSHPRCLLTTLPGEGHALGLLMLEALLMLADAHPVPLEPQTPIAGIVRTVEAERIDVVCLSFSIAYPPAQAVQGLTDLRCALPAHVQIWAGGQGVKDLRKPIAGVQVIPEFDDLFVWLAGWRCAQDV